jgi:hypothetical protein
MSLAERSGFISWSWSANAGVIKRATKFSIDAMSVCPPDCASECLRGKTP